MRTDKNQFSIKKRKIGLNHPTFFIADLAANHDGNFERAKKLIFLAKKSGADAVKFQHFLAPKIVSDYGFKKLGKKAGHQSNWKNSVYETYEKYSLNREWDRKLVNYAKKIGILWMTTPYDFDALNKVNKFSHAFKIGSGDITWIEFLKTISLKKKPVLLATGASSFEDVKRAVNTIYKNNKKICIMQCNTNYTNSVKNFEYINLRVLNLYRKKFPFAILGLSDHTEGHATVLGAVSLGARIIEKHFTDNRKRPGPDHYFSMDPNSWIEMVKRTRELESSLGIEKKIIESNEKTSNILQRRCIRLNKDLAAGKRISLNDVEFLRPAPKNSYAPYQVKEILKKKLKKNKKKGMELYKVDFY
tara:strand:+ start:9836 stop:10915 length:1080 start_codon:yes stop_codon:yes gene_type:complete